MGSRVSAKVLELLWEGAASLCPDHSPAGSRVQILAGLGSWASCKQVGQALKMKDDGFSPGKAPPHGALPRKLHPHVKTAWEMSNQRRTTCPTSPDLQQQSRPLPSQNGMMGLVGKLHRDTPAGPGAGAPFQHRNS